MVTVASIFRNSSRYVDNYFQQIDRLRKEVDVRVVVAEGDSEDDTWDRISAHLTPDDVLLKVEHGGPHYPSLDIEDRWRQLSFVCNAVMDRVAEDVADADTVIWVESDLVWPVDTMLDLLDGLNFVPAVAGLCLHAPTNLNYETWGGTVDGEPFTAHPPYHPSFADVPDDVLVPIDTMGSVLAMRGALARHARFSPVDCIRGFCRDLKRLGGGLWMDREAVVFHP